MMKITKVLLKRFLIIPVLMLLSFQVYSAYFISDDVNIKDSGMAGAYAPFTADSFSAFVNPAGLALVPKQEISLVYYNLFEGAILSAASYSLPLLEKGTIAVSVLMQNNGSVEERDSTNKITSTFDDSFTAIYASYGISIFPFLNTGITFKYLYHEFYTEKSGGFGADLGATIIFPYDIKLAIIASNLIKPELNYNSGASDLLPIYGSTIVGWAVSLFPALNDELKLSAGISMEEFNKDIILHAGAEYSIYNMFYIRTGFTNEGISAGATAKYQNAEINYALVQKAADIVHRFSIAYNFGDNIRLIETQFKTKENKARYELIKKITGETVSRFEEEINDLIKTGDYDNARITIDKALVWSPNDEWFLQKQAEVAQLIRTDKIKVYFADADSLIQEALYIDALVSLKNILDLDPQNEMALAKMKRAQELIRTLGDSNLTVEAGNKEIIKKHFELGLDSYASGNFQKAIDEWDQVIKASPLQRQVYNYIKLAQDKIKKREESVSKKKYQDEKKLSALYNEAVILYTKGDFEKSIGLWKEYLKQDPNNSEAKDYIEKITKEFLELQKQKLEW